MTIGGVRVYPQTTKVERGAGGTPIFCHGRISHEVTDFYYLFSPMMHQWSGSYLATEFAVDLDEVTGEATPVAEVQALGRSIAAMDMERQLMVLQAATFNEWGKELHFFHGALIPVFWEIPDTELLRKFYWDETYMLSSANWPPPLRAVLHLYDDVYWELYSSLEADLQNFIRVHRDNPRLRLYHVELDAEYPTPSNKPLIQV